MHRHHGILSGVLFISLLLMLPAMGNTQSYSSGSTGADGAFNPASSTTLTLPPTGVFNFTTINIPAGVTVTFTKNAVNTPATLLATGNVTISGVIDVSGSSAGAFGRPGQGGPGGFDGGAGGDGLTMTAGGTGLGPGAGGGGSGSGAAGGGGGYGSPGGSGYFGCSGCTNGGGGSTYGSGALRPMAGGSGGGGGAGTIGSSIGGGGGGGGGAILIASSTSIAINGNPAILANGGSGGNGYAGGGGGSGGAIRLIAPTITGTGSLRAQAGSGYYYAGAGGNGRIRIEATTLAYTGSTTPVTITSLPQPVYPGTGQPSLAIASIAGISTPANPAGSVLGAPDIMLPVGTPNPVAVVLAANNVPLGTTVQLSATPQGGNRTTALCTLLDGTQASSACTASINISLTQTNILTATATFPLVASAGDGPIYAEGEEVRWVRIAGSLGGPSTVAYITASGKEVPATALAGRAP